MCLLLRCVLCLFVAAAMCFVFVRCYCDVFCVCSLLLRCVLSSDAAAALPTIRDASTNITKYFIQAYRLENKPDEQ